MIDTKSGGGIVKYLGWGHPLSSEQCNVDVLLRLSGGCFSTTGIAGDLENNRQILCFIACQLNVIMQMLSFTL